jgi:ABC-type antimicrobial peptide transport system permease subunit
MGIPILAGRDFTHADDETTERCVVISESVARRYFPGTDAIGHQLAVGGVPATIVGVARNVRYTSLRSDAPLMIYRGYRQESGAPANTFLIRTSLSHAALTAAVHAELREAAPVLPLPGLVSVDDQIAGALVTERMLATLSSAVSLSATMLAAIGIYSTVASAVTRRRREIGIRLALGGQPGQIRRMVLRDTCGVVAAGLAAGILAVLVVGQWARDLLVRVLFDFSPTSPTVLMSATMAIALVASLAAWLPARRASRTNLVTVMKQE